MTTFHIEATITRSVGNSTDTILLPIEAEVGLFDGHLEIHSARITDSVKIGGKVIFRAGEPTSCFSPQNLQEIEDAYRSLVTAPPEYEPSLDEWERPEAMPAFVYDQRGGEGA